MRKKFLLLGAAASLALVQTSPAQQLAKPLSSLAGASLTGKISCHGISNVPMTTDQAQTLPMQIVATLECGQEVAVLSDAEGYTMNVRTADGKNGYVARMYLAIPSETAQHSNASGHRLLPSAQAQNGIVHWQAGTTGSYQFTTNGSLVESLTANGVTVQVSLQDTGWKMRANVAIANANQQKVHVNPALFTLAALSPSSKSLAYQDPRYLANAPNHQVLWTSASAGPGVAQTPAAQPASHVAVNVAYKMPLPAEITPVLSSQPQADAPVKGAALREGVVPPDVTLAGAVWFERDKRAQHLVLRVPVDGLVFEFPLSFDHER